MPTDIFISYRRKNSDRVLPLIDALRDEDISPWLDQREIGEFAPITDEIRKGLAESKALLAWYSVDYPKSRPCQMELTAAFLAVQRAGDPRRRVLVVNPEAAPGHIEPIELRDAQYAAAPLDAAGYTTLAKRIAAHVGSLPGALGGILPIVPPSQYGLKLTGANRFVGRLPDLWRIHSALHATESAIISGASAAGLVFVNGLGGVGKSLLAEEYALRFGAAYPGGIFWLRAFGNDPTRPTSAEGHEAGRVEQFGATAVALGIDTKGLQPAQLEALLAKKLTDEGKPFLWVVDDLASHLQTDAVKAWLAPSPLGKTLITTRSREYGKIGTSLPLGVLAPQEAFELLCARRKPVGAEEESAARGIVEDLGDHTLAVDVAGAALDVQAGLVSFAQFRVKLANPATDELEFAAELVEALPSGHEPSVAATLLRSVRSLSEEGQDFLRLASVLAVAPISPKLVALTIAGADGLEESQAIRRATLALSAVERASLAERAESDARLVHALVSRAMRFHDTALDRTRVVRGAAARCLTSLLSEVADVRSHARLATEVQHARALCAADLSDLDSAAGLAGRVARHDYEQGIYGSARALQEQVLSICRRVLGEEHPGTLASTNNLASTLSLQGDLPGARALQEKALSISRRVLGEEHPYTLMSMHGLAGTLGAQGNLPAARVLQEQVLSIRRRVLGEAHPETLRSMHNLGEVLRAQGDLPAARALQEQVLSIRRRVLGGEHPDTLRSMHGLASTLGTQGDLPAARALGEQVLSIRRRVLGEEHPDTLRSMNILAGTLGTQGDLPAARALGEQALSISRRVLGERHPDTTASAWNLVTTLFRIGESESAARILGECLAWLASADAASLSSDQRAISRHVLHLLRQDSQE
jgi:tetratricopeptide (TPR) repeat protein